MNLTSFLWALWSVLQPIILVLASTVGTALAAVISAQLVRWLNIKSKNERADLEGNLRNALHQSAENGINLAKVQLSKAAVESVSNKAINVAIDYVKQKNPAAVRKLKVSDAALADIVKSKIGRLL
jgi:hypothetical protein